MFCHLCFTLSHTLQSTLQSGKPPYALTPTGNFVNEFVPHAPSFVHLVASSTQHGCELCAVLVRCARDQISEERIAALAPGREGLEWKLEFYNEFKSAGEELWIKGVSFYFGREVPREGVWGMSVRGFEEGFWVELVGKGRDGVIHDTDKGRVLGRPIDLDPASEDSLILIRKWINECETKHEKCNQKTALTLPTRVIDVGSSDGLNEPHLVNSEGRSGKYCALTHVWGSLLPVTTVQSNLTKHLAEIPLASLPPTFRDAVLITRRLGIKYLWIDALCIIQDSTTDWEVECARMNDIYRNSAITVAAVDSPSSISGFLDRRPASILPSVSCKLPCIHPYRCAEAPLELVQREPSEAVDHQSPLTFRAWCLQEKLLSPRVLYFGNQQTYWNCNTAVYLEAYGTVPPDVWNLNFEKTDLTFKTWRRIVNEYSSRNLTRAEDKLPALSGIASVIHQSTGYHYLAGLWKEDLFDQLFWLIENPRLNSRPPSPAPYIAPSWSWASIQGPLGSVTSGLREPDIQILSVETQLAGLDPFGRVKSGTLTVRGKLRPAIVRYKAKSDIPDITYRSSGQSLYDPTVSKEIGRCSFDHADFLVTEPGLGSISAAIGAAQREISCLELEHYTHDGVFHATVMILQDMGVSGEDIKYWRIGMGYLQDPSSKALGGMQGTDLYADYQERTIVII